MLTCAGGKFCHGDLPWKTRSRTAWRTFSEITGSIHLIEKMLWSTTGAAELVVEDLKVVAGIVSTGILDIKVGLFEVEEAADR